MPYGEAVGSPEGVPYVGERGGQIVASSRSQPRSFNRLLVRDQTSDTVNMLLQGRLVRINRATFEVEPWLAEKWDASADGLTYTFYLRPNLTWSDGALLLGRRLAPGRARPEGRERRRQLMTGGGQPIRAEVPTRTVIFRLAGPSGPGVRIFDALPIRRRSKLGAALAARQAGRSVGPATPPSEIAGMGPFVLREHAGTPDAGSIATRATGARTPAANNSHTSIASSSRSSPSRTRSCCGCRQGRRT